MSITRHLWGLVVITLFWGCGESAQPPEPPPTPTPSKTAPEPERSTYSARTFFETTSYTLAGDKAWSADGTKLLIGSNETGTFNVYTLAADGSSTTPLTDSTETAHRPLSWFPDDDRVLYTADNGGDELNHV